MNAVSKKGEALDTRTVKVVAPKLCGRVGGCEKARRSLIFKFEFNLWWFVSLLFSPRPSLSSKHPELPSLVLAFLVDRVLC